MRHGIVVSWTGDARKIGGRRGTCSAGQNINISTACAECAPESTKDRSGIAYRFVRSRHMLGPIQGIEVMGSLDMRSVTESADVST